MRAALVTDKDNLAAPCRDFLQVGDSFTLLSVPVSGFATVKLPDLGLNQIWANRLAVDGTIQVIFFISIIKKSKNLFLRTLS